MRGSWYHILVGVSKNMRDKFCFSWLSRFLSGTSPKVKFPRNAGVNSNPHAVLSARDGLPILVLVDHKKLSLHLLLQRSSNLVARLFYLQAPGNLSLNFHLANLTSELILLLLPIDLDLDISHHLIKVNNYICL